MKSSLTPVTLSLLLAMPALAQTQPDEHTGHHPAAAVTAQAPAADMTAGEVRKVDKAAGKLTLKHGEIKNLDMPPMTMIFEVKDKAVLDKFKTGDKVRFKAANDAGTFIVTEIQAAP